MDDRDPGLDGTIGARVRARRRELGLSQRDIAGPGLTYAYISRVETGSRLPSIHVLRKLARRLDVSVHWLETGERAAAEDLARLVLQHADALPPEARPLAERVLAEA